MAVRQPSQTLHFRPAAPTRRYRRIRDSGNARCCVPDDTLDGNEYSATTLQNTNRSIVKIHYRFHPYVGQELEVIHQPVRRSEWIIVRSPRGSSLKLPQWMVQPSASEIVISPNPILSANALARLMDLMTGPDLKGPGATVPQKEKEGQRATASTQSGEFGQRRENRAGSGRRSATGRAHGGDDARRHVSRKGDR